MWSLDIQIDAVENTLVSQRQKLQYALFAILLYNLKKHSKELPNLPAPFEELATVYNIYYFKPN